MPRYRALPAVLFTCGLAFAAPALAQQRPLATEDPEPVGAGRVLLEAGFDVAKDQEYPASGLEGTLLRMPIVGVSIGISPIAELQIDGGPFNRLSISHRDPSAPLAGLVTSTGDSAHDVDDIVVATKIRFLSEREGRPALAIRFATKLPNAGNESGMGLDTTDFAMSLIGAKTVQSIRLVANLGFAILGEPTEATSQNDVLTYGVSVARATSEHIELVGEINGRVSTRSGDAAPGTETRGLLRFGGRYTRNPIRFDASIFLGLTPSDPTVGFGAGVTYVFDAFKLP